MSRSIHEPGTNVNGNDPRPSDGRSLRARTRLILLLATLTGVSAAVLTYLAGQPWPMAVLAAGGATAAAVGFFDKLLG
jgi:small-conductance mechanosensitive channel